MGIEQGEMDLPWADVVEKVPHRFPDVQSPLSELSAKICVGEKTIFFSSFPSAPLGFSARPDLSPPRKNQSVLNLEGGSLVKT